MADQRADLTITSRRVDALQQELDRQESNPPSGAPSLVVEIVEETTLPTDSARFFACKVQDIEGEEEEGEVATFSEASPELIYAVCLGPGIPSEGDKVLITLIGGRWSFGC